MLITLPYPPSVNAAYRTFNGRMIISRDGRKYIDECVYKIQNLNIPKVMGKICVIYGAYAPDRRGRDLANLDKLMSDCCTKAGLWEDDSDIDLLMFARCDVDKVNPRVEMILTNVTGTHEWFQNRKEQDARCCQSP